MELCADDVVGAFTKTSVSVAVVSIRFRRPLPPLVVSIPVEQPTNRRACAVTWTALVILTPVVTSELAESQLSLLHRKGRRTAQKGDGGTFKQDILQMDLRDRQRNARTAADNF